MKLRFFLSHRHEDHPLAELIKGHLEQLGDGEVTASISETIPGGQEWEGWITRQAVENDVLLLIYTTNDHDWSWCYREVGLFEGAKLRDGRSPMVTGFITDGLEIPPVVARYQFYRTRKDDIERFLRDAFERGEYGGGADIVPFLTSKRGSQLRQARDEISAEMLRLVQPEEYFHRRVVIRLPNVDELSKSVRDFCHQDPAEQIDQMLANARLEGKYGTLGFLSVDQDAARWPTLVRAQQESENGDWLNDVVEYLKASLPNTPPARRDERQQILAPMQQAGAHYLPVIARVEYRGGWPAAVVLIFVKMPPLTENPGTMLKLGVPYGMVYLATLDRMSRLFRWGFIEAIARQAKQMQQEAPAGHPQWQLFERRLASARQVLDVVERQGQAITKIHDPESTSEATNLPMSEAMERLWGMHHARKMALTDALTRRDLGAARETIRAWQSDTKDLMLAINRRMREELDRLEPRNVAPIALVPELVANRATG
jgi:hypothetical protein